MSGTETISSVEPPKTEAQKQGGEAITGKPGKPESAEPVQETEEARKAREENEKAKKAQEEADRAEAEKVLKEGLEGATSQNPVTPEGGNPEGEKEDMLRKIYEHFMKIEETEGWAAAMGSTIWYAMKLWFGYGEEEGGDEDEDEDEDEKPKEELLNSAKQKLKELQEKNPTWIEMASKAAARYDLGPKGPAIILAIMRHESRFDPKAKAETSSALGLGQFIDGTWNEFQNSLSAGDPLKDKPRTDPEAAITAMAWYCRKNTDACALNPEQSDYAARLYEAHHEGAGGAKVLTKYRQDGTEGTVPENYLGKAYPSFGAPKIESFKDYATVIENMAARVQDVATLYQTELES
ncbi:transglycosylase SLT domain-containing protein [Candidatus Peregrinibacteria bacterium]|nr:MAG: transglycosylase SLT domain-containing protein [Candidatus Peregrinibacteria bacterium]